MSILLTDEQIEAIPLTNLGGNIDDLNIAKAQLKKVLIEGLTHTTSFTENITTHWMSNERFIALLKEIEE